MPARKQPSTEIIHSPGGWVIDKRISLPTLLTLLGYGLFTSWYVAKIDSRVTTAQETAVAADVKAQKAVDTQTAFGERLVRIETLVEGTNQAIARVEKKLEK